MRLLIILFVLFFPVGVFAQVTLSPAFPSPDEPVTITYDATQGNSQLAGVSSVYMHAGVITSGPTGTSWQYVRGNWGQNDGIGRMQQVPGSPNLWRITIVPRQYFAVPANVQIFRIGMVFREGGPCGTSGLPNCREGKNDQNQDIFVNLSQGFQVSFSSPPAVSTLLMRGEALQITLTSSRDAQLQLLLDGNVLSSSTGRTLNFTYTPTQTGRFQLIGRAEAQGQVATDTLRLQVVDQLKEPLPSGAKRGINYLSATEALLVLEAPKKRFAHVIGDFNDWQVSADYQMKQTPDGEFFWYRLSSLEPQKEYIFQYLVDGQIRVADPYTAKISRSGTFGDAQIIAEGRYPGLLPYPEGKTQFEAGYLQTEKPQFEWKHLNYDKPAAKDLVIYELLVRDFTDARTYAAVTERLDYLKGLGINAIELMPIKEFEGNLSWGYNPAFFFAADKFYGPEYELKRLIDEAHGKGMVVILDMVLNHAFGQNPMVRLYNEGDYGRPLPENPWFNVEATHPFSVGYDFNHESPYTQRFVDTVNYYWLHEFKFDGYRYDLSKGFTQRVSGNDVAGWSAYDASRVRLLKRMYDKVREHHQDAYLILEHFADNSEEKELSDYGFLLWGNMNGAGRQLARGNNASLNGGWHVNRNWNDPHLVGYMESHDEERLMWEAINFGQTGGGVNLRNLGDAVNRMQLLTALFMAIPGPKMIWQFGEFGYDLELNNDRLGIKPTRWNYLDDPNRRRLFQLHQFMFELRKLQGLYDAPEASVNLSGTLKSVHVRKGNRELFIFGNAGLSEQDFDVVFPGTGTWFDLLANVSGEIPQVSQRIRLKPNQFYIMSRQQVAPPAPGISTSGPFPNLVTSLSDRNPFGLSIYPNPGSNYVFLKAGEHLPEAELSLYDIRGMSQSVQIRPGINANEWEIETAHLASGVYLFRVNTGNQTYQLRWIKN